MLICKQNIALFLIYYSSLFLHFKLYFNSWSVQSWLNQFFDLCSWKKFNLKVNCFSLFFLFNQIKFNIYKSLNLVFQFTLSTRSSVVRYTSSSLKSQKDVIGQKLVGICQKYKIFFFPYMFLFVKESFQLFIFKKRFFYLCTSVVIVIILCNYRNQN